MAPSDVFRIVCVCSGNRCRSPYTEATIRARAEAAHLPVEVSSVGTLNLPGHSVPSELVRLGASAGFDLTDYRSRSLADADLAGADLVIGYELEHVAAAVIEGGAARSNTFMLAEIVRLLEQGFLPKRSDPVERARLRVRSAGERRAGALFDPADSLADPFGGPYEGYVEMSKAVSDLSDRLITLLFAE